MSYARSWGDGFDFNDLKAALGFDGIKGTVNHIENTIGLHGFNGMGKAHGTNTLGAGLLLGGSQAIGALGGGNLMAGSGSAGTGGGFTSGLSGMFGGGSSGSAGASAPGGGGLMSSLGGMFGGSGSPSMPGGGGLGTSTGSGLLSSFETYAKPVSQGLNIFSQGQGMFEAKPPQPQPMQQQQGNPNAFASLIAPVQQVDPDRRARAQQMAVQGLLGGYRG